MEKSDGAFLIDAGGTRTRLIYIPNKSGNWGEPKTLGVFSPKSWNDLEKKVKKLIGESLGEKGKKVLAVCFAGRCLKNEKTVSVTKWGEPRKEQSLFKGLKIKDRVFLNDMEPALAALLSGSADDEMIPVAEGEGDFNSLALMYLGTGLGVGLVAENGLFPSEFSAIPLPLDNKDPLESKLSKRSFLTMESVLSGPGLSFLAEKLGYGKHNPEEVSDKIISGDFEDAGVVFARLLGRASRMLVLTTLADRLVLGGKPISAFIKKNHPVFLKEFLNDKDHGGWLKKVKVEICKSEELPSFGLLIAGIGLWEEKFG